MSSIRWPLLAAPCALPPCLRPARSPRPRSTASCKRSPTSACWPTTPTPRPILSASASCGLAHAAWNQTSLAPIARPHLDALSHKIGLTVHLAQLDNGQVLYVDKRNATQPVEMFSDAGKIGPAYCTGVGKAMLALSACTTHATQHAVAAKLSPLSPPRPMPMLRNWTPNLTNIRHRGHAYDREEHEPGIICIAVPILSSKGQMLGGLSITGSTRDTSATTNSTRWCPDLTTTAQAIAADAEAWRFPVHLSQPISGQQTREPMNGRIHQ